jgi:glucan phosphoethanolaminetransferase (alkaline phosphatase superfamily)
MLIGLLLPSVFSLYGSRVFMPYAFPYAVKMYYTYLSDMKKPRIDISKIPSTFNNRKNNDLNIIFIIGEAARADHFHINGYDRPTSPYLEKAGAISFPYINSVYSTTATSVPRMLTRWSDNNEIISSETSMISIFNKHHFATTWISYQDILGNHFSNIAVLANEAKRKRDVGFIHTPNLGFLLNIGKTLDEKMIPGMQQALKEGRPRLIVLHCMGSHWIYRMDYPDDVAPFSPACHFNNPVLCPHTELINSYDNSILYADYFISAVIEKVKRLNAVVVFCADHGEFLGENGNFLHPPGRNEKEVTNPAMFVWMSEIYKSRNPEKYRNLIKNRNNAYTSEVLFHSILDAASIEGAVIDKKKSIFN